MAHPEESSALTPTPTDPTGADREPLAVDALVEDVSIDGMCGVY